MDVATGQWLKFNKLSIETSYAIIITGESEVSQTPKSDENDKPKSSGNACNIL